MSRNWHLLGVLVATALVVQAQAQSPGDLPRLGVLNTSNPCPPRRIFLDRLAALGWVDGRTVAITCVSALGRLGDVEALARSVLGSRPHVIVTGGNAAIRAFMSKTSATPIVMVASGDPVRDGFVASLSRPGGNVTGMATQVEELELKRVELLRQAVPGLSRLALLSRAPDAGGDGRYLEGVEAMVRRVADAAGFKHRRFFANSSDEYAPAFAAIAAERYDAVYLVPSPLVTANLALTGRLAREHRLPAIGPYGAFADAGGLISYGVDLDYNLRRSAEYVDKLLRGAKAAELPVEQSAEFELVLNLISAKALGLSLPPTLLARATRVIEE